MDRPTRRRPARRPSTRPPPRYPSPADAIPYNLSIPTGWVSASRVPLAAPAGPKLGPRRPTPHRPFLA